MTNSVARMVVRTMAKMCAFAVLAPLATSAGPMYATSAPAPISASGYSRSVLADHPVAYYQMDETTGSVAHDSSGNGHNAVYRGGVTLGAAGAFPGTTAIQVGGGAELSEADPLPALVGGHDRTVEVWFKSTEGGDLFEAGSAGHASIFDIVVAPPGDPGGCGGPTSTKDFVYVRFWDDDLDVANLDLLNGAWPNIATTVGSSGKVVNVYVDGARPAGYVWDGSCYTKAPVAQPFNMPFSVNTARAGFSFGNGSWSSAFTGDLDQAAVFGATLSPSQVKALSAIASQPAPEAPEHYRGLAISGQAGKTTSGWVAAMWGRGQGPVTYRATLDWGDGAQSSGTVQVASTSSVCRVLGQPSTGTCLVVDASHVYARSGAYQVSVQVTDVVGGGQVQAVAGVALVGPQPPTASANPAPPGPAPVPAATDTAIGELVGIDPQGLFEPCTATVVYSQDQDVIVTAGHCVKALYGDRPQLNNFTFAPEHTGPVCPDLNCGQNPLGVWHATKADVYRDPRFPTDQRYDYAFIRLAPNGSGAPVGRVVVPHTISFEPKVDQDWAATGFPVDTGDPQGGSYPTSHVSCAGTGSQSGVTAGPGPENMSMPCQSAFLTGASGGPWVDDAGAVGAVNKAYGGDSTLLSTPLVYDAEVAYLQAEK